MSQRSRMSTSRASQRLGNRSRVNESISASQPGPSSRNDFHGLDDLTQSQSTRGAKLALPEDEENHLVSSVIKYLLVADRNKHLIQRAHIVKNAMPEHGKYFKIVITRVKETLRELFGYNLVELEGSKFILTNNVPNTNRHLQFSGSEKADLMLLFITLGHLFMLDEDGCTEDELFDLFRKLDIVEEDNFIHEYFGDVKHLISEKFVKQGYLQLVNVDRSDPPLQHYQWGPRAEHELRPRRILEFMSKIFGGRPLNAWPKQFQIMQTRETTDD